MNRNLILLITIVLFANAACTKSPSPAVTKFVTSDTVFAFENISSVPLHVDMYRTYYDLINQANLVMSCPVPAKGTYKIPFSQIDTTGTYYYYIYSSDYYYSNWGVSTNGLPLFYEGHRYEIDSTQLNHANYYFLWGNNASTTWKAVDMRNSQNISQWSTLSTSSQNTVLTLNRNLSGTISYYSGGPVTAPIQNFSTSSGASGLIALYLSTTSNFEYVYNSPIPPNYNFNYQTSRDTIVLQDEFENCWIMAHQ